jgi:hypothetical protein
VLTQVTYVIEEERCVHERPDFYFFGWPDHIIPERIVAPVNGPVVKGEAEKGRRILGPGLI